jgi:Protein of unknown function (DUF2891)
MADVLGRDEYAGWLGQVLPRADAAAWAPLAFQPDGADPGTVHLEGRLISRAWCLDAIGLALPPGHLWPRPLSPRPGHICARSPGSTPPRA